MKKYLPLLILFLLSNSAFALYQAPFPKTALNKDINLETRLKDNGQWYAQETIRTIKTKFDNKPYIVATSYSTKEVEKNQVLATKKTIYYTLKDLPAGKAGKKITVVSQTIEKTKDNKPWQSIQLDFDWSKRSAQYYKKEHDQNKESTKTYDLTDQTFPLQAIAFYFQNLIDNKIKEDSFVMINPDGENYKMNTKVSYKPETLTVQGKKISCYKIEMKVDLGLISAFVPSLNCWYRATKPHTFVRYQGLEKGLGSPNIIQEITSL